MYKSIIITVILYALTFAENTSVTFVNPGGKGDPFFQKMTEFMFLAAEDLNIDLEVIYCDRNHIKIEQELLEIVSRKEKPDYLLLINEKNAVAPLLPQIDSLGIPFYLFNEGLLEKDRIAYGNPGKVLKNWIGELLPNDYSAGKLLAEALFKDQNETITTAALAGVMSTNSSITREQGFIDYITPRKNIQLTQIVPAYHDREKARFMTKGLIDRFPKITVFWAASDIMAIGALDIAQEQKRTNWILGGVDWSNSAYLLVKEGKLTATVGGHFLDGARVLLQIAEHVDGKKIPPNTQHSSFSVITQNNYKEYQPLFGSFENWESVDFNRFRDSSLTHNGITVEQFLNSIKK